MGGYVSLAHPFAIGRKSLDYQHDRHGKPFVETVMERVDAIELYNGGVHRTANVKASHYAKNAGKRLTVGSDAHRLRAIGTCGTYLNTGNSTAELFHALTTHDDLRFKVRTGRSTDTLPMLGIIALKHTHHFVRAHARRKRA
jgi:hypothetical protein